MSRTVQAPYVARLVASAARTATGNSGAITLPTDLGGIMWLLSVTAASGTSPTLDLAIQVTDDDGTTWFTFAGFTQHSATGEKAFVTTHDNRGIAALAEWDTSDDTAPAVHNAPLSRKIRIVWTIGGTNPSFTFSIGIIGVRSNANVY